MVAGLEAQLESLAGPRLRERALKEGRQERLAWVLEAAAVRALVRVVGQERARLQVGARAHALLEARWRELPQELGQPVLVEVARLV